jgi:hypothetical protein
VGHESAASVKKREKQPDRMIGENPRLTHFFKKLHITSGRKKEKETDIDQQKLGFFPYCVPVSFFGTYQETG